MAIPARHIDGIAPHHLMGAHNHVFENFVERMADMNIAIGIWRAVMQHEFFAAFGGGAQALVQTYFFPMGQNIRLALRQAGFHRKFGLRQVQRLAPISVICLVTHGLPCSNSAANCQAFRALGRYLWRFALAARRGRQIFVRRE